MLLNLIGVRTNRCDEFRIQQRSLVARFIFYGIQNFHDFQHQLWRILLVIADGDAGCEHGIVGMNGGPGIRQIRRNVVQFGGRNTIHDTREDALGDFCGIHGQPRSHIRNTFLYFLESDFFLTPVPLHHVHILLY